MEIHKLCEAMIKYEVLDQYEKACKRRNYKLCEAMIKYEGLDQYDKACNYSVPISNKHMEHGLSLSSLTKRHLEGDYREL